MTNKNIIPFDFEGHQVRTITDEQGYTWLVLTDLLSSSNSSTTTTAAIESIKEGLGQGYVADIPLVDARGITQQTIIVREEAVTFLISRMKTEEGKRLNRWIHGEVLPSIRKTGSYSLKPRTLAEQSLIHAQLLVEQERQLAAQEERLKRVEAKQQSIEEGFKFFTVLAWAKLNDLVIGLESAQKIGKRAAAISRERAIPIDRVRDPRFGQVNAYHESIIQEAFAEEFPL